MSLIINTDVSLTFVYPGVFNKIIILIGLAGYKMIIANEELFITSHPLRSRRIVAKYTNNTLGYFSRCKRENVRTYYKYMFNLSINKGHIIPLLSYFLVFSLLPALTENRANDENNTKETIQMPFI